MRLLSVLGTEIDWDEAWQFGLVIAVGVLFLVRWFLNERDKAERRAAVQSRACRTRAGRKTLDRAQLLRRERVIAR